MMLASPVYPCCQKSPGFFLFEKPIAVGGPCPSLLYLFSFSSSLCGVWSVECISNADGTNNGNLFLMASSSIVITLVAYTVELDSVSVENV